MQPNIFSCIKVIPPSCCQPNGKNPTISVNEEQIQVPVPDKSCPNFYPPIEGRNALTVKDSNSYISSCLI